MKSVVICGSRRFLAGMHDFAQALRELGVTVFEPNPRTGEVSWDSLSEEDKRLLAINLTSAHFRKIELADAVFVYNEGGYAGVSTTMEIAYAVALRKPIFALSADDEDYARKTLFQAIAGTPEALIRFLERTTVSPR